MNTLLVLSYDIFNSPPPPPPPLIYLMHVRLDCSPSDFLLAHYLTPAFTSMPIYLLLNRAIPTPNPIPYPNPYPNPNLNPYARPSLGGAGESRRIKAFKWFNKYFGARAIVGTEKTLTCKYFNNGQKFKSAIVAVVAVVAVVVVVI